MIEGSVRSLYIVNNQNIILCISLKQTQQQKANTEALTSANMDIKCKPWDQKQNHIHEVIIVFTMQQHDGRDHCMRYMKLN